MSHVIHNLRPEIAMSGVLNTETNIFYPLPEVTLMDETEVEALLYEFDAGYGEFQLVGVNLDTKGLVLPSNPLHAQIATTMIAQALR